MGLIDNLKRGIVDWLNSAHSPEGQADKERANALLDLRSYFAGIQKPQLKVKPGGADDNIALNLTGLVVDRAVSRLFGAPVTFDLAGEGVSKQDEVLTEIWDANKQAIFLHKVAQFGAIYGTCFVKIVPEGVESRYEENKLVPRLVALNPLYMRMAVDPLDLERVLSYTMEFQYVDPLGNKERHREVTEIATTSAGDLTDYWTITRFISGENTSGNWVQDGAPEAWPFEFAPILAWQNMPLADSVYGKSDIEGVIELQDRINFVEANISKIIRYHASPKIWYRGMSLEKGTTWGSEEMIGVQGVDGEMHTIEMASDLDSSRAFGLDLRQTLFDVTRTVDITSIVDKIGTITNLGLRLIFKDELDKLESKRNMYGEALTELNHRLLTMSGFNGEEADGGIVIWPDPLPIDEAAKVLAIQTELGLGTLSKQTAAGELGRDWEQEQERIQGEGAAGSNLGDMLLKAFDRGAQKQMPELMPPGQSVGTGKTKPGQAEPKEV